MLFLFDIDGTLLRAGKSPRLAFKKTIKEVFGVDVEKKEVSYLGKTDLAILFMYLEGVVDKEKIRQKKDIFFSKFYENFKKIYSQHDDKILLPHVKEAINFLNSRGELKALLTGNSKETAYEKLKPFNIHREFEIGAFGDESEDRLILLRKVHRRAEDFYNKRIDKKEIVVVGDSIPDIEVAKEYGVKSLIVLTGWTEESAIRKASPDFIMETFRNFKKVYTALKDG